MSVEFYRGSPGKFDSRTLSRETLRRWTGRSDGVWKVAEHAFEASLGRQFRCRRGDSERGNFETTFGDRLWRSSARLGAGYLTIVT